MRGKYISMHLLKEIFSIRAIILAILTSMMHIAASANDCTITYYSSNYNTAKWCYLSLRDQNYHLQYVPNQNYITVNHSQTNRPDGDAYLWAFVGTPETGFRIYNKAAGNTMILSSLKPTGDGGSTYPTMMTESEMDTELCNTTWDAATYGMGVKLSRHEENTYLSEMGGHGKLNFWTSQDAGSRFMITPANETLAALASLSLSTSGKTYMLINRFTGKALGNGTVTISNIETNVATSTTVNGIAYDNHNVQWSLTADGAKWQLVNKNNSYYLNTAANNGYLPINSTVSSYHLRETGDGYYYLLAYTSVGSGDGEKIALADDGTNSRLWAASGLPAQWELREVSAVNSITSEHYYRLHNAGYEGYTMSEYLGTGKVLAETNNDKTYSQIWKITSRGSAYTLQNVMSGRYIQGNPGTSTQFSTDNSPSDFYEHTTTIGGYTAFAFNNTSSNSDTYASCLHCDASKNVVGWTYGGNNHSYWYLEEVTLTSDELTAISNLRTNNVLSNGNYYRITSGAYTDRSMSEVDGKVNTRKTEANAYTQMWKTTFSGDNCTLQNAWTDNYIQGFTASSEQFTTGATAHYYTPIYYESGGKIYYTFGDSGSNDDYRFLHCAATQSYNVVGWRSADDASKWTVEKVDVTSSAISAIKTAVNTNYTQSLAEFFNDPACTVLNSTYASMSDDELRSAMSSLPAALRNMAVCVKNNKWRYEEEKEAVEPGWNSHWNFYEKDFRIHEYDIYSNNLLWRNITKVGPFARLNHPTGITAVAGDILYIFVNSDVKDSDASLQAELVTGIDRMGSTTTLTRGYNTIYVDCDCELFITYHLNNTDKSCNDYPKIKIHIEGGTMNGCFDIAGHNHGNSDWQWMKENMYADEFLHVKGNSTMLNCYRERVVDYANFQDVEKIMAIWDFCFDNLESLSGCDQWKDTGRYKMMTNNFDATSGYPHWSAGEYGYSQPGIYYDGIFNANVLTTITRDGAPIWVITHELGHGHQEPINLSGQTESSNNSLAQCVNFLTTNSERGRQLFTTTRSSRGSGVKQMTKNFNDGYSWIDYGGFRSDKTNGNRDDTWTGNKMIFQLWLYFDYLGNYQPTGGNTGFSFMTALYDALRSDPIEKSTTKASPKSSTDDWLKVAKYASQITKTDLSEFFEAWGFWALSPTITDGQFYDDASNSIWCFNDYSNTYVQTSQSQVNEIKAIMNEYPIKAGNIMFIEDRGVGSTLSTFNDEAPSTFGDVGYYETYSNKVTAPYSVSIEGTTVTISGGTGAVGYKVYDDKDNLVAISNMNTFTVSSDVATAISNGTYTVMAAQGDGRDYTVASTGHEAEIYEGAIPYILKFNGTEIARVNAAVENGDIASEHIPSSLTNLASEFSDWIFYTYEPETIEAGRTTEVVVNVKWKGPFQISSDYSNAKWCYLRAHSSYNNYYVSTSGNNIVWAVGSNNNDAYKWAFIGDPYNGFKLANKAAGNGYYLIGTNPATMGTTEKVWKLKKQTDTTKQVNAGEYGFGFWDETLTYLNPQDGTLKYWGSFDQGSTFWVKDVPEEYLPGVTSLSSLSNNKAYVITNARATWAVANSSATEMTTTQNFMLGDANQQFAIIEKNNQYYIWSVNAKGFLRSGNTFGYPEAVTIIATNDNNYPWFFKFDDNNNINVGGSNQIVIDGYGPDGTNLEGRLDEGNKNAIIEAVDFDPTEALSYWFDFRVNSANSSDGTTKAYATAYYIHGMTLPDGVEGYILKMSEATIRDGVTYIVPTNIGSDIPARTPVLLVGTEAGNYSAIAADVTGVDTDGNILVGTTEAVTSTGTSHLVLNKDDYGHVGFYNLSAGQTLAAGRAYIPYNFDENGVHAITIVFDDTDGIVEMVNEHTVNGKWYDLSGRLIVKPKRGMYIVNGKKVIIK